MYSLLKRRLLLHDIHTLVVNFLAMKTSGNALTLINFVIFINNNSEVKELISGEFIKVQKGVGIISSNFRGILILEEPFIVNSPLDRLRTNLP
jgi:hypothetical protein